MELWCGCCDSLMPVQPGPGRFLTPTEGCGSSSVTPTLIGRCRPSPQPNCARARPPRPSRSSGRTTRRRIVLTRGADGSLSAGDLRAGMPAIADLPLAGRGIAARRLEPAQLVALAGVAAGRPRARRERACDLRRRRAGAALGRRGPRPSLPRPRRAAGGTRSGAPRSTRASRARWPRSPPRCPPSAPTPSTATATPTVHDLYPVLVDQIARDRLRADRVRLAAVEGRPRRTRSTTSSRG